jgi:ABC-2 type transport system ATP-binding protein
MIDADGLSKNFDGRPAIAGLTFRVPEGQTCALLGPNGAGKTTTVRVLLGLLQPTAGRGRVAGCEIPASDAVGARLRAQAGLLTEAPGCYDRMSGRENLELFGGLYGLDGPALRAGVEHWLRRLELWEARDRPFGTWSKGMKQRLALIRAVLHQPRVLFLDEPTAGLDPAGARDVRDLIAEFRREGRTILLCTHNLSEAEALADLVGILRQRLLAFGSPASLCAAPTGVVIQLAGQLDRVAEGLRSFPSVRACALRDDGLHLVLEDVRRDTPGVVREIVRQGGDVLLVRPEGASLEEVYLRAVREDAA